MLGCLFFMVCFVFIQFFASSIYMYLGAGILLGIPWGVFQVITTTYASEICPTVLRPYLTSLVSMCWSIGYLLGTGVLTAFLKMEGQWAYRIPFALQWVLPIPLAIGILLAPESPWWLVRKNRVADAEVALRKLRKKDVDDEEIANTLSMMVYTIKIENDMNTSSAYKDLFKGENLRRTEITVFTYVIQEICVPMLSYVVYFLQQAGLPTSVAFKFGLGQYSLAIVGVVVAWFLTPHFGRRTLILSGISFVTATTFLIGFLGIPTGNPITYGNAIGSILLLQYFVFFFTCGPVIYTVVTEIPSSYLRSKSVSLARATYNVNVIIYGQLMPRTTQKAWWNWGAKAGFFYGGIMCIGIIWGYFRLPETKGRTFAEIDILFKNKVRARDFTKTKVDIANQTVSREE
jgi:SP family general alpha glucoside:H+ symporter-like MFS transporter